MSKLFKFTAVEYRPYPMFREWDTEHKWPTYNVEYRYELPPMEFDDLWDAEEWFVKTYPQYCIGYSIVQIDEDWRKAVKGGDFALHGCLDDYAVRCNRNIKEAYALAYKEHLANFESRKQYR